MSEKTPYISPRLSPILQKYKTPSLEDTDLLRNLLSFEQEFEYFVNKQILDEKNKNICIHPHPLVMILADQFKDFDLTQELNESYSPEDYINWYRKYSKIVRQDEVINDTIAYDIQKHRLFWGTSFINCTKRFLIFSVILTRFVLYNRKQGEAYVIEKDFEKKIKLNGYFDTLSKEVTRHACFLIVDTVNKKGYFLDPAQRLSETVLKEDKEYSYMYKSYTKIIKYKCEKILKYTQPFLGIKEVEVIDIDAPQSITNDYNCLFWSLLLCDIIVKNLRDDKAFNPKNFIKSLLKKYNTKEKLERVIRRYISYVYETSKSIPNSFYKNMLKNTYIQDRLSKKA